MKTPTETDILRFIVALADARDDEDHVKQVIDDHLAAVSKGLHAAYLKVALRVVIAQFYAVVANKLDGEVGHELVDMWINYQRAINEGRIIEPEATPSSPTLLRLIPAED